MNPLQAIPPKIRLWLYVAYGLAGLAVGSVATYCAATDQGVPTWVAGVSAVLVGPLAAAFGGIAASNLPSYQDVREGDAPPPRNEGGYLSLIVGVLLALILLVVLLRLV